MGGKTEADHPLPLPDSFVPVNQAIIDAKGTTAADYTEENWSDVIGYAHVVSGQGAYYSSDFTNGMSLQTVQGDNLTITVQDGTVYVNGVQVLLLDILTDSGVVG